MNQENLDTEKIIIPREVDPKRKDQASPSTYSLEIPGGQGRKAVIFVPQSFSRPAGFDPEVAGYLSNAYTEAFGVPDENRELRLHEQVGNWVGQLLAKVERNLQLIAEAKKPKDQTITVWTQTKNPQEDFIDRTTYLLLASSTFQFGDPVFVPSQGRRQEEVETEYSPSTLLEKTDLPYTLALVEQAVFEPKTADQDKKLLGRTISLQFSSYEEWNRLQAAAAE